MGYLLIADIASFAGHFNDTCFSDRMHSRATSELDTQKLRSVRAASRSPERKRERERKRETSFIIFLDALQMYNVRHAFVRCIDADVIITKPKPKPRREKQNEYQE